MLFYSYKASHIPGNPEKHVKSALIREKILNKMAYMNGEHISCINMGHNLTSTNTHLESTRQNI